MLGCFSGMLGGMITLPSPQQIRYLLALDELRHFGRAAQACSVTQSTLSAGILALERQLDARLLDRDAGRRVVFTPLGDEVAGRGRLVLEALEAVQDLVEAAREPLTGPVRMGVIPTIGPFLLHRLIPLVRERFPQINLQVTEDMTERLADKLQSGRLDVLLLAMPCACEGIDTVPLWRDPLRLVIPMESHLGKMSKVSLDKLTDEAMILPGDGHCLRDQVLDICREGLGWTGGRLTHTAASLHSMVRMIGQGLGVGLVPQMGIDAGLLAGDSVTLCPVTEEPMWRTIGLGWRQRSPRRDDFRALASAFRSLSPQGMLVSEAETPAERRLSE